MRISKIPGVTGLLLLAGQASASQVYQQALAALEADAAAFIQGEGYVIVDPDTLTDEQYYSKKNFPDAQNGGASISLPDADLDPITRAILLFDAKEASLPHARYRITYSMNVSPEVPQARQGYVEVTRYNVGPVRRNDLLAFVPEAQVAAPEEFGVGPHVSWRFAMAPVMGARAGLLHASRKEIPDARARVADCLGEPCLGMVDPVGPNRDWIPLQPPSLAPSAYAGNSDEDIARPARVIEELWASMSSEGMDDLPYTQEQPPFVLVVSWNTAGQDVAVSGLARQFPVMDDSVSEIWTQRYEMAQSPASFSSLYVPRY